jgi:hypothetical protein
MAVDLRRRRKRGKAAFEIGGQILDRFKPDMEAHRRPAGLPVRRGAIGRAVERRSCRRLSAATNFAQYAVTSALVTFVNPLTLQRDRSQMASGGE